MKAILLLVLLGGLLMPLDVQAQAVDQTPIAVVSAKTLPAGATSFGPIAVPKGALYVHPSMEASAHTDPSVLLTLTVEVSYDSGAHWQPFGSTTQPGGTHYYDDGTIDPNVWFEQNFPHPESSSRQMRGSLAVVNVDAATVKQPSVASNGTTVVYK